MLKILVITYDWPPRNSIGTHRPYSWAKYWSKLGAEVTVLTSQKKSFDAPLDLTLNELPKVNIIQVDYKGASVISDRLILKPGNNNKFVNFLKRVKKNLVIILDLMLT